MDLKTLTIEEQRFLPVLKNRVFCAVIKMKKKYFFSIFFIALAIGLTGCFGAKSFKNTYVIGVDPSFFPIALEGKQGYALGFLDELLDEISQEVPVRFIQLNMSWDNLIEGLRLGKYAGAMSAIAMTTQHEREFDFSLTWLKAGPVLVVPIDSKISRFDELDQGYIACIQYTDEDLLIRQRSGLFPHYYLSSAAALNGVVMQEANGAVIQAIPAYSYIQDLYYETLKIAGEPIGNTGLRLVAKKGENRQMIELFNQGLTALKEKGRYQEIAKKWKMSL